MVDVPNHRSSHAVPTPRVGGVACALGSAAALGLSLRLAPGVPWQVLIGSLALGALGFLDDQLEQGISALSRLAAQMATGALIGAGMGQAWWVVAGIVVVPTVVNSVNFMDGVNGITSLTMAVWGTTALALGVASHLGPLAIIGGVTAGVALGFLPFNAPVARLFLGDVGSYLFGGLVAGGWLFGVAHGASPLLMTAPLSIYLADTGIVLGKRATARRSLREPHREHVYQRLVHQCGLPHFAVAGIAAGLSALITVTCAFLPPLIAIGVTFLLILCYEISPSLVLPHARCGMGRRA